MKSCAVRCTPNSILPSSGWIEILLRVAIPIRVNPSCALVIMPTGWYKLEHHWRRRGNENAARFRKLPRAGEKFRYVWVKNCFDGYKKNSE